MARKRHSTEEVIKKLREAEIALGQGQLLGDICKKLVITQQTYYRWRKEYGGLRVEQARRPGSSSARTSG